MSFFNYTVDIFESFSANDTADYRWETANRLIRELGGTALNMGALDIETNHPIWMLSSMTEAWLTTYVEEKLFEIDPFIPHLMKTNKPFELDTTKSMKGQPLNAMLMAAGYSCLYGMPFSGTAAQERQVVTYCSDRTVDELMAENVFERARILGAILITQFSAPNSREVDDLYFSGPNRLTPREKEALVWLAHGLRNDGIAMKMNVTEITVRKHISAARIKLGAMTREQALVIALKKQLIMV